MNFSNNPTFVSGSLNELRHTSMKGNPTTFITQVQLFNSSGDVVAYYTSDERLKYNIQPIENPIDKVSQLRGVDFKWKEKYGGHQCAGVIAQEIETVLPHLVDEFSAEKLEDGSTMKSVNYNGLWGVMIEALKEAKTKIETLETEVAALKAK